MKLKNRRRRSAGGEEADQSGVGADYINTFGSSCFHRSVVPPAAAAAAALRQEEEAQLSSGGGSGSSRRRRRSGRRLHLQQRTPEEALFGARL